MRGAYVLLTGLSFNLEISQGVRISTSIPQSRRGDPFQPKGVTQIAAQAPSTRRTLILPSSQQWEPTTG